MCTAAEAGYLRRIHRVGLIRLCATEHFWVGDRRGGGARNRRQAEGSYRSQQAMRIFCQRLRLPQVRIVFSRGVNGKRLEDLNQSVSETSMRLTT